jgi:hypothetical protein
MIQQYARRLSSNESFLALAGVVLLLFAICMSYYAEHSCWEFDASFTWNRVSAILGLIAEISIIRSYFKVKSHWYVELPLGLLAVFAPLAIIFMNYNIFCHPQLLFLH